MIVLTSENWLQIDKSTIHKILDMDVLLHIRNYTISKQQFTNLLECISPENRKKIVLHSFHEVASSLGINRLHFNSSDRFASKHSIYNNGEVLSTSVHTIQEFNSLEKYWDYAFLSPVFTSISKFPWGKEKNAFKEIKKRTNFSTKLIALGGIKKSNIRIAINQGADDTAILGALWSAEDPIRYIQDCINITKTK